MRALDCRCQIGQACLRFVDAWHPWLTAAVSRRLEARPRFEPRISWIHRHGVEDPLPLAGFGIEGLQVTRRVEIVAGSGDHMIANDDRCHR